jgi:hypothetical protein
MNSGGRFIHKMFLCILVFACAPSLRSDVQEQKIEWPGLYHLAPAWSPDEAFVAVNPLGGNRIVLADKEKNVLAEIDVEEVRFIAEIGWLGSRLLCSESSAGRYAVYYDLWDVSADHGSIRLRKRVRVLGGDYCRISPDLHYLACFYHYDDNVNDFVVIADTTKKEDPEDEMYEDHHPFLYPGRDSLLEGGIPLDSVHLGLDEWVGIPTGPPFALRIVDASIGFRGSSRYLVMEASRPGEFPMVGSSNSWGECFMAQCHIPDGQAMRFENYKTGLSYGIRFHITDLTNKRFCIDTVQMLPQEMQGPFLWDPFSKRLTTFEKVEGRRFQVEFSLDKDGQWKIAKKPL